MSFKLNLKWAIAAVIGLFFIYLIGTLLFFNATPKEKRITQHMESSYSVEDSGFKRESGLLTGRGWVENNAVEVFTLGEETYSSMLEDINNAEKSILKETYNYFGEDIGNRFAEALSDAARRGVSTHFLMDFVGSATAPGEYFNMMEDAGVQVVRWRQPSWYQLAQFNHRTHRKLLVVDGKSAYTGGMNTADPWLSEPAGDGYKDYHFRFQGPVVGELAAAFSENWVSAQGELLIGDRYYPEADSAGGMPMQVVISHPGEGKKQVRKLMMYALASARENVRIGSAYFFPDEMFIEAIVRAAERGVDVKLLMPGEKIDKSFVRYASQSRWGSLLDAGVRMYEYQPAMYHAKIMIVDDYFVSVGSTNFDNRSFRFNDEANVNVLDGDFGSTMAALFDEDLLASDEIGREEWEQRPFLQKMYGRLVAMLIGAYL